MNWPTGISVWEGELRYRVAISGSQRTQMAEQESNRKGSKDGAGVLLGMGAQWRQRQAVSMTGEDSDGDGWDRNRQRQQ